MKHLCRNLFFDSTLGKRDSGKRCFRKSFAKIFRSPFLQNTPGLLLLEYLSLHNIFTCSSSQLLRIGYWHGYSFVIDFTYCYVLLSHVTCPYLELIWSVFSRIRTEYGDMRSISLYSVRMRENTDQNNSKYGHFLPSDCYYANVNFLSLGILELLNFRRAIKYYEILIKY